MIKCYSINRNMYLFIFKKVFNYKSPYKLRHHLKSLLLDIYICIPIKIIMQRNEGSHVSFDSTSTTSSKSWFLVNCYNIFYAQTTNRGFLFE